MPRALQMKEGSSHVKIEDCVLHIAVARCRFRISCTDWSVPSLEEAAETVAVFKLTAA